MIEILVTAFFVVLIFKGIEKVHSKEMGCFLFLLTLVFLPYFFLAWVMTL